MINTVLFDLDGTLLPMNQDKFLEGYFNVIASKFKDHDVKTLLKSLQYGIKGMLLNDGSKTNEEAFWDTFYKLVPKDSSLEDKFIEMYENEFQTLINYTNPSNLAKKIINTLKAKGYTIICATNPLFPKIATYSRIKWAGLNPNDFKYITTFENSKYAKPNLDYYKEIIEKNNLDRESCLMVGNDVSEDLCVKSLGLKTFLLTDNLINSLNVEIDTNWSGSMEELLEFVNNLNEVK